jgi:hypothetical protein
MRQLKDNKRVAVEKLVLELLHASRDYQRNRGQDTKVFYHDVNSPYYAEAFGVMRGLAIAGHGRMDVGHTVFCLRSWFDKLADQVLAEENMGKSNECDFCFSRYGKDAVRRR